MIDIIEGIFHIGWLLLRSGLVLIGLFIITFLIYVIIVSFVATIVKRRSSRKSTKFRLDEVSKNPKVTKMPFGQGDKKHH